MFSLRIFLFYSLMPYVEKFKGRKYTKAFSISERVVLMHTILNGKHQAASVNVHFHD